MDSPPPYAALILIALLCSLSISAVFCTDCVYTLYVKTGTRISGGTNSVIGVTLFDEDGDSVTIDDIVSWGGLMGDDYDYFERGQTDIFSGLGTCTSAGTICALNLTSDGSGTHPGWYVNYVEATITGYDLGCDNQVFSIQQWVAPDAYPYQLYAFRNNCDSSSFAAHSPRCGRPRQQSLPLPSSTD